MAADVGERRRARTGQNLFNGAISGGGGATGLFAWKTGVTRKILAQGDVDPLGGTFTDD